MSAEIVNLRRARKAKARADKEREAAQNRVTHGRSKGERRLTEAQAEREQRAHEGHRRPGSGHGDDGERGGTP